MILLFQLILFILSTTSSLNLRRKLHQTIESTCLSNAVRATFQTNWTSAYDDQQLQHCTYAERSSEYCSSHWDVGLRKYVISPRDFYNLLLHSNKHFIHRNNSLFPEYAKKEYAREFNLVLDARCHHMWPQIYYHRFADCLIFILPALYNYILSEKMHTRSKLVRQSKILVIVDESTEKLCSNTSFYSNGKVSVSNEPDYHLNALFSSVWGRHFEVACYKVSMLYWSPDSFQVNLGINFTADEYIWLQAQRDPNSMNSGPLATHDVNGSQNLRHQNYVNYIKDFRQIMFNRLCVHCPVIRNPFLRTQDVLETVRTEGLNFNIRQDTIVLIIKGASHGRNFEDQEQLIEQICSRLNITRPVTRDLLQNTTVMNSLPLTNATKLVYFNGTTSGILLVNSSSKSSNMTHLPHRAARDRPLLRLLKQHPMFQGGHQYRMVVFRGKESLCETMALFWTAKVVIAVHGGGIVNTVFARESTLLVEITPDRIEPDLKGQLWRSNSAFAQSVGLSTHILIVPHNSSARTDEDLQKRSSITLQQRHVDKLVELVSNYIYPPGNRPPTAMPMTSASSTQSSPASSVSSSVGLGNYTFSYTSLFPGHVSPTTSMV